MSVVTLEDFKKVELRVAKILEVHEIPGADKLWRLRIDLGAEQKQIVAGIKAHYTSDALVGKSIVIVHNLAPAVIRGTESNGMLLAAKHESSLTILTLDKELPPGSVVG